MYWSRDDLVIGILHRIQNNQTKQLDAQIDGGLFDHLSVVLRIEHSFVLLPRLLFSECIALLCTLLE